MGRAKALCLLVLPFLVFAVVVFLFSEYLRIHPAAPGEKASQQSANRGDGWLFANSASSSDASVEVTQGLQEIPGKGATTVTTYTVMGKF
jgi:hypothetical protein